MVKLKYKITEEEYLQVKEKAKQNKNKRVDKKLQVIILRYEGLKDAVIADRLGYNKRQISVLCGQFKKQGLEEYIKNKYCGNNQALSTEEELAILNTFEEKAKNGELVTAQDIKKAFDERRGKDTGRGYIYMLLGRHDWRMVMPRGRHPKKASDEVIEASKKLTIE